MIRRDDPLWPLILLVGGVVALVGAILVAWVLR